MPIAQRWEAQVGDDAQPPPSASDDFAAWVAPHLPVLVALAVREVGSADAEDVVQEALLRAWRRRGTFRAELGTPRAWLVAVLLDRARRHRVRSRRVTVLAADGAAAPATPDESLDLDRAIAALPPRQRQAITLHYLADLSVADIAAVLGIAAGSVKSALHDARARLREELERP